MRRKARTLCIALAVVLAGACSSSHNGGSAASPGSGKKGGGSDGAAGAGKGDDGNTDGSDAGGGANGGGGYNANVPNANLPMFPGSGTSDAGKPLPNGKLCDSVAGPDIPIEQKADCFYDKNNPGSTQVAATLEQVLECAEESQTNLVHLRLTFHPWFVDNTYGASSIGWPRVRGHRFNDLVKSDHAELILTDHAGATVMQFKLDYFSEDASRPSGWGSLGVNGGDGAMITGDAANVVKWQTSLALNFNERGYDSYTVDSPKTDENYSPDPAAPDWDFRVVYEAWVDLAAFGSAGFGGAHIEYVHASPAKGGNDTIEVEPRKCPPPKCGDNEADATCSDGGVPPPPDGCTDNDPDTLCADGGAPPPPGDGCADTDPDTPCTDGGTVGPPPDQGGGVPEMCLENPDDPGCHVE
jgi:hypothetical protein